MTISDGSSPDDEAAAWLTRLRTKSVTTSELDDFTRWRRDPLNAAAYRRVASCQDVGRRQREEPDVYGTPDSAAAAGMMWRRVGPATFALIGVLALVITSSDLDRISPAPAVPVYRTAIGQRSMITLDDGSRMQLDADSEVSASFDGARRRLVLARGQAFFAVRHDAARPFVVEAGDGMTVTATGTRFDVLRIDRKVRVSLVEGAVEIRRSGDFLLALKPGEVVLVGETGAAVPLRRPIEDVLAWRNGHLSFRDTPLEQAVAEMNRYSRHPFAVGPRTDARAKVSGEFSTNDPEVFANAVEALFGKSAIERIPR